jgi:hypothetical protein
MVSMLAALTSLAVGDGFADAGSRDEGAATAIRISFARADTVSV